MYGEHIHTRAMIPPDLSAALLESLGLQGPPAADSFTAVEPESHISEVAPNLVICEALRVTLDQEDIALVARAEIPRFWCDGHFLDQPVIPLAVMAMAMSQTASVLRSLSQGRPAGMPCVTISVEKVHGRRLALWRDPGEIYLACRPADAGTRRKVRKFHCIAMGEDRSLLAEIKSLLNTDVSLH